MTHPSTKRPVRPSAAELQKRCEDFNQDCPVGSEIRYRSVIGAGPGVIQRTRSDAYVLSGHTAVVFITGVSGCVALDAIEIVKQEVSQ